MVGNKGRVEGCIAEEFKYKEIASFTSVYFPDEHNMNAPNLRLHVAEDVPCSNLSIFGWRGKTIGACMDYDLNHEELVSALLYKYSNMDEMTPYFK